MEFIPLVQMGVLVFAIINFLKALNAQEWNSVFTQVFVWIAGVAVVLLVAQTDFAGSVNVGDMTLETLNFWSLLFVGLTIASLATFGNEIKKALDNTDSASTPSLFKD